jgi:hypothetical protein
MIDKPSTFNPVFAILRYEQGLIAEVEMRVVPLRRGDINPVTVYQLPVEACEIEPVFTRGQRRLLIAMVKLEQKRTGQVDPEELLADMSAIVLAAYEQTKRSSGSGSIRNLLVDIIQPMLRIGSSAKAVAKDINYYGGAEDMALVGKAFIEALMEAGRKAALEMLSEAQVETQVPKPSASVRPPAGPDTDDFGGRAY